MPRDPAADKRTNPRYSIKELNELDLEVIKDRMRRTAFDTRGPVTRFLDLLDAPRNTIASTLFSGIRKRKEREGETGAGGRGVVRFSDILQEMGMRPGIATGVLGFVGDVLTDPLTYLGPGGAIKSLASQGVGQTARIARSGVRAAEGAVKAVAAGKPIRNPVVREMAEQFVRPQAIDRLNQLRATKGLAPLADADKAAFLSKRMFGEPAPRKSLAGRFLRPKYEQGGSQIAGRFNRPTGLTDLADDAQEAVQGIGTAEGNALKGFRARADARNQAVKNFVAEYGAAAKPGAGPIGTFRREGQVIPSLRIGSGGSLVAHIPMTDIGIYAPPITGSARMAVAQRAAALAAGGSPQLAGVVGDAYNAAKGNVELIDRVDRLNAQIEDAAVNGDELSHAAAIAQRNALVEQAREATAALRRQYSQIESDPGFANLSVGDMQYQRQMMDTAASAAKLAADKIGWFPYAQQFKNRLVTEAPSAATRASWLKASKQTLRESALGAAKAEEAARIRAAMAVDPSLETELAAVLDGSSPVVQRRAEQIAADAYSDNQKRLLDMTDEDIESSLARADALTSYMESAYKLAERTRGSIASHLDDSASAIADQAKFVLGLGPDDLGSSIFVSPRTIAESIAGGRDIPFQSAVDDATEALARQGRSVLGSKRAGVNIARAALVRMGRGSADDVAAEAVRGMHQKFETLARAKNWTPAQQDAAKALIYARMYESHPLAGKQFWTTDLQGNPSKFVQAVQDAPSLGITVADIDPIVDEARTLLTNLGEWGQASGDLTASQRLGAYVPKRASPEFQRFDQARSVPRGTEAAPRAEDFANASKTWQYRFKSADGTTKRFFEFDRWLTGKTDEQIDAMELDDVARESAKRIRDTIAEFDELHKDIDPALRTQLTGRATDPMELNELAAQGYFRHLFGTDPPAGMRLFSEDPVWVMRNRVAEQAKASAADAFRRSVLDYGIDASQGAVAARRGIGGEFTFANGTKATILPNQRFRVGGTVYRPLASNLKFDESLMAGIMGNRDMLKFYPEQVAEQIERAVNWSSDLNNQNGLLRSIDKITGLWKAVTLARPAWVVFNVVGNLWNMGMGGVDFTRMGRLARPVWEAVWLGKSPDELLKRTVNIRGVPTSLDALRMKAMEDGIFDTNRVSETMQMLYPKGAASRPVYAQPVGVRERIGAEARQLRDSYRDALAASLRSRAAGTAATKLDAIKAGAEAVADREYMRKLLNPLAGVNNYIENYMRLLAYATLIDQGMDSATAAMKVKEFLFDFTDITNAESWVRRAIPFYSWIRNNGAYQLRQFLQNPKWAALYPKVKDAVEEAVAGEQALPEHMRPTWMREQMATQLSSDPESRPAFTAGNVIPTEPVLHVGAGLTGGWRGLMDLSNFVSSSLNPIITGFQQLGTGREFYSGRTIGPSAAEGDIAASEFIANQILPGPIKDVVSTGVRTPPLVQAFRRSPVEGVARIALGGRVQPMDQQRVEFQNLREMKEREERIRKAIAVAEREGNIEASQDARARLLQLYEHARKMGLERAIPKWAVEQLENVNADVQPVGV